MDGARCIAAMYHYVSDPKEGPAIRGALHPEEFSKQLDWLQEHYRILSYKEFREALDDPSSVPSEKPSALLTFDDGLTGHFTTVFPELKRRGITGVFFLCPSTLTSSPRLLNVHAVHALIALLGAEAFQQAVTEDLAARGWKGTLETMDATGLYRYDAARDAAFKRLLNYELPYDILDVMLRSLIEKFLGDPVAVARRWYATPDQIQEMAQASMTFGGHTHHHRVLSRLKPEEQRAELEGAVSLIQSMTKQTVVPFAFPYGQPQTFTEHTLTLLQDLGYDAAFSTIRGTITFGAANRIQLERVDTKDLPPFGEAENL